MWTSITPEHTSRSGSCAVVLGIAEGDARLWRYVLYQALMDLCFGTPVERAKVVYWLKTKDMGECCDYAGLDTDKFLDTVKRLRSIPEEDQRDFLHQLKRYLDNME